MIVDWSLRLGDVVSFLGFALGGLSVIFMMKSDIKLLAQRLGFLERVTEEQNRKIDKQSEEIGEFGKLLTIMGRYEERMGALRRDLDELRHGRGFVVPPPGGKDAVAR